MIKIAKLIKIYLSNEGYHVLEAYNGRAALELIRKESIQLVILDIMMPEMDGLEVCRAVRADYEIPILILSAKAEDMDKIMGLMTGADDYMVKPFNPLELLARVKSLLRRASYLNAQPQQPHDQDTLQIQTLKINKITHTVTVEDKNKGKRIDIKVRSEGIQAVVEIVSYREPLQDSSIPFLYERFYRVEHSRSQHTGGSGLGLAIAKNIVELHNGTISVASNESGTSFEIRLPVNTGV